jgi:adenosylmethionine-8-amino-7-oxononanoate aminotransferase
MREVCNDYGMLLIFDEIMCGMGRTGYLHAWQKEQVVPDIQLVGKGLAGGFMEISGMLVGHKVHEVFENGPSKGAFNHGHTFQGQAEPSAAALATQLFIQDNKLLENVRKQGPILMRKMRERLQHHRYVGDIRGAEEGLFFSVSSRTPYMKTPSNPNRLNLSKTRTLMDRSMRARKLQRSYLI